MQSLFTNEAWPIWILGVAFLIGVGKGMLDSYRARHKTVN